MLSTCDWQFRAADSLLTVSGSMTLPPILMTVNYVQRVFLLNTEQQRSGSGSVYIHFVNSNQNINKHSSLVLVAAVILLTIAVIVSLFKHFFVLLDSQRSCWKFTLNTNLRSADCVITSCMTLRVLWQLWELKDAVKRRGSCSVSSESQSSVKGVREARNEPETDRDVTFITMLPVCFLSASSSGS